MSSKVTDITTAVKFDPHVLNILDLVHNLKLLKCSDTIIEAAIDAYGQINAATYTYNI